MGDRDPEAALRTDYERIALAGIKLSVDADGRSVLTADQEDALTRLQNVGLLKREGDAISLYGPAQSTVELHDDTLSVMHDLHRYWLRTDDTDPADEILYGEVGYWQHLWNMMQSRPDRDTHPLVVDAVASSRPEFTARDWAADLDDDVIEHVRAQKLLTGRIIVPPVTLGSPAESIVEVASRLGLSVRVFPANAEFVIYDGIAAVLPEEPRPGEVQRHQLTRRPAMVEPLTKLFAFQWAAAVPWETHAKGSPSILHLLAQGWTDERIADALGISSRTVSRRVAEAMTAAGVQSRFELGMNYALAEPDSIG